MRQIGCETDILEASDIGDGEFWIKEKPIPQHKAPLLVIKVTVFACLHMFYSLNGPKDPYVSKKVKILLHCSLNSFSCPITCFSS